MYKSILCVCLGNICRSALAEAVFRDSLNHAGVELHVDSAGTGPWHVGNAPDPRAVVAARLRGYDLTGQSARQVRIDDFAKFDLILAMDHSVVAELERMRPDGNNTEIKLFTDIGQTLIGQDIPDPYYSGQFDPVLDMIEKTVRESLFRFQGALQVNSA